MLEYIKADTLLNPKSQVITLGSFDGLHLGHRFLINDLIAKAEQLKKESLVIVFQPHPREVLRGEVVSKLTTLEEQYELLTSLGVDRVFVLPFTREVAAMSGKEFIDEVLLRQLGMVGLVLGYDHSFGKNRDASDELIHSMASENDFDFVRQVALELDDSIVSSSQIRGFVEIGAVEKAGKALGRPYLLKGKVVEGQKRGRTIGFPTANMSLSDSRKMIPARGVYAVRGMVKDYFSGDGMLNIGVRPSFDDGEEVSIETFFFNAEIDLYGKDLTIEIWKRLRDELKFDSVDELKNQLVQDELDCIKYFKSLS